MTEHKNTDPDGCPDQISGGCVPACVYCKRDMESEVAQLRDALDKAVEDMQYMIGWVPIPAREKWDLTARIERARAARAHLGDGEDVR